jgi:hypothetical protein
MTMTERTPPSLIFPCALLLALAAGCGGIGLPGGGPSTPPPAADRVVTGEVAWVDAGNQELEVQHRTGRLQARYDANTRVVYRGEDYRPENLERGDQVRVEVADSREAYADTIEVTRSVQESQGGDRRDGTGSYTGTVEWIDERRGEFGLRTDNRDILTVEIPFDARDSVRDELARLDRGDFVRIEAEPLERDRLALVRFL